jgi:uridine kinase
MSSPATHLFREIEEALESGLSCGSTRILTIDGRAGSGKTTLASDLFLHLSASRKVEIIHLDDLYAGWEGALESSLSESLIALTESLKNLQPATLNIFNWGTSSFDSQRIINPPDILIIEGVGSGQGAIRDRVGVKIWMEISPEAGLARVLERDGHEISSEMSAWQLQEDRHFEIEKTRDVAEFVLSTD